MYRFGTFVNTGICKANAALENTFVQFYPVLYDVAERIGTLDPAFKAMPITQVKLLGRIETEGWASGGKALDKAAVYSPNAAVLDPSSPATLCEHLLDAKNPPTRSRCFGGRRRSTNSRGLQSNLADAYLAPGNKEAARAATKWALELATPDERERLSKDASVRLQKLQ
jgi:hypothetical protein